MRWVGWYVVVATVILGLWIATPWIAASHFPKIEQAGQFGDLFGSINALFSGLAILGLYINITQQRHQNAMQQADLAMQREELAMQRQEMVASRGELAKQVAMQQALIRATNAQIAVAGYQAKIEALKLDASAYGGHGAAAPVTEMQAIARALLALSAHLDKAIPPLEDAARAS